ncbi:phage protein gp26 [Roseibium sp. TrichSKD4]|uniref:baseplate J/gp47 family protein n=1 Tax=Roseibium sp. TrichSKD4 TaxID=744980 RepID=UPI0001E56CD8|nr:baseplate J/gp47 family protein [Roseibium sp. TrichSKD4]EFO32131.1 phage protein gp26 [Roseibium sp. TrichSKD4]
MTELSSLPKPQIIEELDIRAKEEELLKRLRGLYAARGIEITTLALESESATALTELIASVDNNIRTRINDAARSNLLAFAKGSDLDHLVAWLGITRLEGEGDERLKRRYQLAVLGRSAGGPPERYIAIALGASLEVRDVKVWAYDHEPVVNVAVLSAIGNGDASPQLLEKVRSALELDSIKVTNDRFNVISAVRRTENLLVQVRLAPDASLSVLDEVKAEIPAKWAEQDLLGLDLDPSWVTATARIAGVTGVKLPNLQDAVPADEFEAIGIGTVEVEFIGRGR